MNPTQSRDKKVIAARKNIKEKEFWFKQLSGGPLISHFPFDMKKACKQTKTDGNVRISRFHFDDTLCSVLMTQAKNSDHRLHILLMAGIVFLLYKYTYKYGEKKDIVITTPIYKPEVEGEFINTLLPLRSPIESSLTVKQVLNRISNTLIEAINHQNYPIEVLSEQLNMPFLSDAAVVLENIHNKDHIRPIVPKMVFSFTRSGHTLDGRVEYDSAFYNDLYVKEIKGHLPHVLAEVFSDLDRQVSSLNFLPEKDREHTLNDLNQIEEPLPGVPGEYTAPRNKIEETLAEIWADLLEKDKTSISIDDSFFELDGQSLKAIMLSARIHKVFNISIPLPVIFGLSTIMGLADYIKNAAQTKYESIKPAEKKEYYTLSPAQKRLYILKQLEPGSINYNVPQIFRWERAPCKQKLEEAFRQLINRHESLRTSFEMIDEVPVQKIHKTVNLEIEYGDIPGLSREVPEGFIRTFDLSEAPLLRVSLIKVGEGKDNPGHILLVDMHHIISDATTRSIFRQDFAALYEGGELSALKLQYKDYSQWLNRPEQQEAVKSQEEYWLNQFQGEIPVLNMPTDFVRPAVQRFEGNTITFAIGTEETFALKQLIRHQGITMFMGLLGVLYVFLSKMSGQEDIVVGTPVKGRRHVDLDRIVGIFVNTLALRNFPVWEKTFAEFMEEVKQKIPDAFDNQEYPIEELVDRVMVNRDMSRNPLFDAAFTFGDAGAQLKDSLEANLFKKTNDQEYEHRVSKFDLTLAGEEQEGRVKFYLTYAKKLFKRETISRWVSYIKKIIAMVVENPGIKISGIVVISREEKRELLIEFNTNTAGYAGNKTIHQLFAQQAEKTPDRIALIGDKKEGWKNRRREGKKEKVSLGRFVNAVGENISITYRELNQRCGQLAGLLIEKGVQTDTVVGIVLERSPEMIIGILAILKAGGAYMPIDPEYPQERINYMLTDSGVSILVTSPVLSEKFKKLSIVNCQLLMVNEKSTDRRRLNNPPKEANSINNYQLTINNLQLKYPDLAYIIYTSGSTGRPKGVMVEHGNVARLVRDTDLILAASGDRLLLTGAFVFDITTFEIWYPLLNGLTLFLVDQVTILDAEKLGKFMVKNKISILHLIPQLFNQLAQQRIEIFAGLKYFLVGGDLVHPGSVNRLRSTYKQIKILHMYGPTENTTFSTFFPVDKDYPVTIPIGKPLGNSSVYISDKYGYLQPIGVAGELCVGGAGVARGYLNHPELTFERFINYNRSYMSYKSYIPEKLYRTGDLARWLPDGNIEFLGRMDSQVKIRGFRIELGEIENLLRSHEGIEECVVISREVNGENRLVAYYRGKNKIKLWPSLAEYFIYDDLIYNSMVRDESRNEKYRNAIGKAVKDKIVLEIGPGAEAILSRMCIEAGAKKVYAVEILADAFEKAQKTVKQLNLEDKIILIHGDVTQVELPGKVDGCVSEIVGTIGGSEGAAVIINAARKWIKEPAFMIPARSVTRIAAISLPGEELEYGFDELGAYYTNKIFEHYGKKFDLRLSLLSFQGKSIISNTGIFEELDFTGEIPLEDERNIHLEISRPSILTGFVVWLDLYCDEEEVISTLEKKYIWLPIYFPVFPEGEVVRDGDIITAKVIRTLSANHLNPDFTLQGTLYKKHRDKSVNFTYYAPHRPLTFKSNYFYRQVFSTDQLKVTREITSNDLRSFLAAKVPDYMIPAYFVSIEKLPVTLTGKVDRHALPEPDPGKETEKYKAPRNDIEKQLVEIWQDLLGKNPVGIDDNFFAAGGDSIKSIQVAARMSKAGYTVEMRDILQNKTIAQLAPRVKKKVRRANQAVIKGTVPLTPIQEQFLGNDLTGKHHFNQAVLLYREKGFDEAIVQKVFSAIALHHDALRMVYTLQPGDPIKITVVQRNKGIEEKLFDFEVFNFEKKGKNTINKEIQREANRIQAGIDLTKGPLVKLGLFKTAKGDHLLIVIHHLVMDGVSSRVLLEDFERGYRQLESGEAIEFQDKTDSFKYWSEQLHEYAAGKRGAGGQELEKEPDYWQSVESEAAKANPLPHHKKIPAEKQRVKYMDTVTVYIDTQMTRHLMERTNRAYHTEINDILLTALGLAVQQWAGIDKPVFWLEGHGREPFIPGMDISRTIGWFTTRYPVVLDISQRKNLPYTIKSVKENLRRIPNKGIGYGILKYLTPAQKKKEADSRLEPGISFNYLGELGREMDAGFAAFSWVKPGETRGPELKQTHSLLINGVILEGKLRVMVSYNRHEYDAGTMRQLADGFRHNLLGIIRHCSEKKESELTPSDVGYPSLSLEEFSTLTRYVKKNIDGNTVIEAVYPLSPMQNGILYHSLTGQDYDMYFVQTVLKLEGKIEKSLLEESFNQLIRKYDIFRTIFIYDREDRPLQLVLKHRQLRVTTDDISRLQEHKQALYLEQFREKDRKKGFDLSKDILVRLSLFKTGKNHYHLVWSYHHILIDGWCFGIIYKELLRVYQWLQEKHPEPLELGPRPITPYKYYIQWLEKQDRDAAHRYWQDYLAGYEHQAGLSQWKKKEKRQPDKPGEYDLVIDEEIISPIKEIAAGNQVTINTMFQVLWGILLQRYNNCNDVVFGAVVSGRPAEIEGIEHMIGLFINTIPVRLTIHQRQPFTRVLQALYEANLLSGAYEYLSLAEIQAISPLKTNLIDHIMVFENYPLHQEIKNAGTNNSREYGTAVDFKVEDIEIADQTNYDFNVIIIPGEPFITRFSYNPATYESDFIERVGRHFVEILKQVKDNPQIIPEDIIIITAEEKEQILGEFNRTEADYPKDKTIHRLFSEQVKEIPDNTALLGKEEGHLTYKELDKKSHQLAHVLREKGVQPDSIVGIMVERSIGMVFGILGILMAGGAYLPIEPETPPERIKYTLLDSEVNVLVSKPDEVSRVKGLNREIEIIDPNTFGPNGNFSIPPAQHTHLNQFNLAYAIYTSGSTGKPKGVLVEHRSVVNIISALSKKYPLTRRDSYLLKTSYLFDVSVTELFGFFGEGGRLVVLEKDAEKDPQLILDRVEGACVTHINFVPSMFNIFTGSLNQRNIAKLSGVKYIFLAGEALQPGGVKKFKKLAPGVRLENLYGPTEGTVYTTGYSLHHWSDESTIPIGKPLQNVKVYIVDRPGHVEPVGIPGELLIGGVGAAAGYLNNPELTFERFISYNRAHKSYKSYISKKLYKTGDLARWQTDGNIEFLGRIDHQVKIRGFRVEPAEIESQLVSHTKIKEAIVLSTGRTAGADEELKFADNFLCAYLVPARPGTDMDIPGVREYLSRKLPYYMIPSYFIKIDRVPLTPGGKVDRKALPGPDYRKGVSNTYHVPRNSIEKKLAEIWASILLGKDASYTSIGIDDNFFEVGGHSLKATILLGKIHREFNVKILLKEVFKTPTIRSLAEIIVKAAADKYTPIEPTTKKDVYVLSSAQKRLYFTQLLDERNTRYNILGVLLLLGSPDRNKLEDTFRELIERHESLRTSFEMKEEVPVQRIRPPGEVLFEVEFYHPERELSEDRVINDFVRPFDLSKASLFRVGLIQTGTRRFILLIDMHHIITDGMSLGILTKDFMALYSGEPLPPLRLQYKDFSQWQNRLFESGEIKEQEEYWLNQFAGEIPVLNLPTDFPRSSSQGFIGGKIAFKIEKGLAAGIKKLTLDTRSTLFVVLLTVFNILLSKYTGQEDIVAGTGVAGRRHPDLENIIGMFVNLLALRNQPKKDKSFLSFLNEVKENILNAFANQDYPFDELVKKLNLQGNPSRNPLFDVAIQMQDVEIPGLEIRDLKIQPHGWERKEIRFDLVIYAVDSDETIDVFISFSTALFKMSFAERMQKHLVEILEQGVTNREIKLKDIKLSMKLAKVTPVISKQDDLFGF